MDKVKGLAFKRQFSGLSCNHSVTKLVDVFASLAGCESIHAKQNYLMDKAAIKSRHTFFSAMAYLKDNGFISLEKNNKNQNIYMLNLLDEKQLENVQCTTLHHTAPRVNDSAQKSAMHTNKESTAPRVNDSAMTALHCTIENIVETKLGAAVDDIVQKLSGVFTSAMTAPHCTTLHHAQNKQDNALFSSNDLSTTAPSNVQSLHTNCATTAPSPIYTERFLERYLEINRGKGIFAKKTMHKTKNLLKFFSGCTTKIQPTPSLSEHPANVFLFDQIEELKKLLKESTDREAKLSEKLRAIENQKAEPGSLEDVTKRYIGQTENCRRLQNELVAKALKIDQLERELDELKKTQVIAQEQIATNQTETPQICNQIPLDDPNIIESKNTSNLAVIEEKPKTNSVLEGMLARLNEVKRIDQEKKAAEAAMQQQQPTELVTTQAVIEDKAELVVFDSKPVLSNEMQSNDVSIVDVLLNKNLAVIDAANGIQTKQIDVDLSKLPKVEARVIEVNNFRFTQSNLQECRNRGWNDKQIQRAEKFFIASILNRKGQSNFFCDLEITANNYILKRFIKDEDVKENQNKKRAAELFGDIARESGEILAYLRSAKQQNQTIKQIGA